MQYTSTSLTKFINQQDKVVPFLFILLAVLTYFPLLSTGFTTNDDSLIAVQKWSIALTWGSAKALGRVGNLIADPLFRLPYAIDSHIYYSLLRFGTPLVLLSVLYLFIRRTYKSSALAGLGVVFFLAFIQNNWQHSLLTSYPFIFNLLAIAFLLSLASFILYLERGGVYGFIAAALYFVSLLSELFVLFFVVFAGIAILYEIEQGSQIRFRDKVFSVAKCLWPIILSLFLFLVLYFGWRYFFPTLYAGNSASPSSLLRIVNVVWIYSVSGFPGFGFFEHSFAPLFFGFWPLGNDVRNLLAELRVEWIVKGLIVMYLTGRL